MTLLESNWASFPLKRSSWISGAGQIDQWGGQVWGQGDQRRGQGAPIVLTVKKAQPEKKFPSVSFDILWREKRVVGDPKLTDVVSKGKEEGGVEGAHWRLPPLGKSVPCGRSWRRRRRRGMARWSVPAWALTVCTASRRRGCRVCLLWKNAPPSLDQKQKCDCPPPLPALKAEILWKWCSGWEAWQSW